MPISETTKQIASRKKAELRKKRGDNLREIQFLQVAITKLKAVNANLKSEADALDADIPEPTPVPEEV